MESPSSIGFLGPIASLSQAQRAAIKQFVRLHPLVECHHLDIVGAAVQFHKLCRELDVAWIKCHPPRDAGWRAYCDADETARPLTTRARFASFLAESDIVLACPGADESGASGTWRAIQFAVRQGAELCIIWPNGLHEWHRSGGA